LTASEWRRLGGFGAVVVALHVVGFAMLVLAASRHLRSAARGAFGLGLGIAYTLGLRRAFDADHRAVDNTTRS
jgi:high-affinity nickel-transport protein